MPNHITNILRINAYRHEKAPKGLVPKIVAAITSAESAFDFERVIPMPKALRITSGGVSSDADALLSDKAAKEMLGFPWVKEARITTIAALRTELRKRYLASRADNRLEAILGKNEDPPTLDEFAALVVANRKKYGAADWYDWSCKNWGTKWNAYSVTAGMSDDREATVTFETAWAPPLPVIDELARRFPKACFRLIWCDEGDDKQHRVHWEKGKREADDK